MNNLQHLIIAYKHLDAMTIPSDKDLRTSISRSLTEIRHAILSFVTDEIFISKLSNL